MKKQRLYTDNKELNQILEEQMPLANVLLAKIMLSIAGMYLAFWISYLVGFYHLNALIANLVLVGSAAVYCLTAFCCFQLRGRSGLLRNIMLIELVISIFGINILTGYKTWLLFSVPIILSVRYYKFRVTGTVAAWCAVGTAACAFTNAYLSRRTGYLDLNTVSFPSLTTLTISGYLHDGVLGSGDYTPQLILRNSLKLLALPNLLVELLVTVLCLNVVRNNQKLLLRISLISQQKADLEVKEAETRNRITLSQIGPHFLYNALSAIMAIEGNPDETVDALGEFSKYLRENLNTLTNTGLYSFTEELKHIRRYVYLEQLRFGERLKVEYDLQTTEFLLPPLTVQMLVENAVKHGISQLERGGTVIIRTEEREYEFLVTVADNGSGFEEQLPEEGKNHVGLANVRQRLAAEQGGSLTVESVPYVRTAATIHIPREKGLISGAACHAEE